MMLTGIILAWAVSVVLLMPRASTWLRRQHQRLEHLLLVRLESFHIFVTAPAVRWIFVVCAGASTLFALGLLGTWWLLPVVLTTFMISIFGAMRWRLAKRFKQIRYQLPDVMELLGTSLRAGLSIRSGLHQVSRQAPLPVSQELAVIERMQRIGISLETALAEWGRRLPIEEVGLLGFTINISSASGGNLADSLDRLAASLRQRLILEEKVDALTAQGRLQAWVMIALPILLAMVLSWLDSASMAPLWTSSAGHGVLAMVALLEVIGLVWIRRLIRMEY